MFDDCQQCSTIDNGHTRPYDRRVTLTSARAIVVTSIFGSAGGLVLLGSLAPRLGVDTHDPVGWLASAPPADALAALGWLVAVLICGHLMITTVVYACARISASGRAARIVGRFIANPVRRSVDLVAAVALSMTTVGSLAHPTPAVARSASVSIVRSIPDLGSGIVPPGQDGAGYSLEPSADPQPDTAPDTPPTVYEVVAGDNLWTIACRHVRMTIDAPGVGDVTEYWLRLIDRNMGVLRSGDPDLIFPGEQLVLPAVPSGRET